MEDYRKTKYCKPLDGIQERKAKVRQSVLADHPRAIDMHKYVSDNSEKYKLEFMEAYNFKCAYCGASIHLIPIGSFEVDHYINQKSGRFSTKKDAGDINNLVLACHDCNHGKNAFPITEENEDDLNPDKENILLNFCRDNMFYIKLTEFGKKKQSVICFYKKLHLGSEIHRIDYLVMSMIGLHNKLKDKGIDNIELSNAINTLIGKRNLMSVYIDNIE